ncbi:unnamed protein product [Caenorhabditis sp. 36 PRJEB53466]|nr:unnamed protein product [Caenorhabditis sp. 36 PRJEB53466]
MMEHYTTNPWLEEINASVAGVVSLVANCVLIWVTCKVKTYSETVRWAQYYSCLFRIVFSAFVLVTSPTVMYLSEVKSLYIVKGGVPLPREIGAYFLNFFVVFVITSCTSPTVQFLQVAYILSNPALNNHGLFRSLISSIPLFVGVPTFILIGIGYSPSAYEMDFSESLIREITGNEDSSFLIASEEKIYNEASGNYEYDVSARVCTFFIFSTMLISLIVVIVCFSHIRRQMRKKKTMTSQSVKSQRQLNLLLLVQFLFPFVTIHIPFYTAFILPYMDIEFKFLSAHLPYLFSWCPAISPILILLMVKNVRDTLLGRKSPNNTNTGMTFTSSHALHLKNSMLPPIPSSLEDNPMDEINSNVAGVVSLVANILLIYATSKVTVYSSSFRKIQYYVCVLRLLFSLVTVLTSPTLVYVAKMKSLYIVKGGFYLPIPVGELFLIIFVVFVVISCSSPTVQYLQLCHLLSDRGHKNERFGPIISTLSMLTGLPALALASLGYTATYSELIEARDIVYYLNGEGDSAFLMVTVNSRIDASSGQLTIDWLSQICTFYILTIMILSVFTVILCTFYIRKQLKKKMMSAQAKKVQQQINVMLALQFTLPFLTVHVPFYVSFILPMFDIENSFLSSNLPYLFSWCPAINPILVMALVKNVRDLLLCRFAPSKVSSGNMIHVRHSQVLSARAQ